VKSFSQSAGVTLSKICPISAILHWRIRTVKPPPYPYGCGHTHRRGAFRLGRLAIVEVFSAPAVRNNSFNLVSQTAKSRPAQLTLAAKRERSLRNKKL
jgi:hypothetical protein